MDEKRKKVEANLRSVIQSSKEGVVVDRLLVEYRTIVGELIPFKELGYTSLLNMLKAIPDVVKIRRNSSGKDVAYAVADENTAHIQSLISRQKTSKPRSKLTSKSYRRRSNNYFHTTSPSFSSYVTKSRPHNNRRVPFIEHNFLQRVKSSPSPPPAPHTRLKSTYVLPPRFIRKKDMPIRQPSSFDTVDSQPEWFPTTSVARSESSAPKRFSFSSAWAYELPKSAPPVVKPATISKSQGWTQRSQNLSTVAAEPEMYFSCRPNVKPSAQKRTVSVMPLDKKKEPLSVGDLRTALPTVISADSTTASRHSTKSKAETSKQLVEEYATFKGCQPIYRTLPIKTKKKGLAFVSTLILSDTTYLSYPTEMSTAVEAEEVAASKAVEALAIVPGQYSSVQRETPTHTSSQISQLVDRVNEIIKATPNGFWHSKVPAVYEKLYSQALPENWMGIIQEHSTITVEKPTVGNFILYPAPASTPASPVGSPADERTSFPFSNELIVPEGKEWAVYVTSISDTLTIAVRLVDYSDDFSELADAMDEYYSKNSHPATDVAVSRFYVVESEEHWFRVLVTKKIDRQTGDLVECYFLDNGDTEVRNIGDLNVLMPQFNMLPHQAILCELHGVSYKQSSVVYQKLMELAFGKVLMADVVSRDPSVSLILFDTSTDDDVNINDVLNEVGSMEDMTPKLPTDGQITEGLLTHVTDDGDLYVQLTGNSLEVLENMTSDIRDLCEDRKGSVTEPSQSKMYCAKYDNGQWYRCFIKQAVPGNPEMMVVWYVDYGNTAIVHVSELCEVDAVSDILSLLPYQAVRCRLHKIPQLESQKWTKAASDYLYKIVPENQNILIKVTELGSDVSPPQVSLFKRIGEQRELVSVNETLAAEANIFVSPTSSPAEHRASPFRFSHIPDVALSAHMSTYNKYNRSNDSAVDSVQNALPPLVPVEIPNVGSHFDITVTLAAHPHNFTVQPWKSGARLDDLMDEMQLFYNSEENICDMHECLLKEGEFYACKYTDHRWYRVSAVKVLPNQTIWVYFVDFGDYYMATLNDFQPLYGNFRKLPFQAIKASLVDVEPVVGDWSPMDCVRFKELVMEKQFVSVIKRKRPDTSNSLGTYELGLTLIDTSISDKDIYIHKLLIEEGSARSVSQ